MRQHAAQHGLDLGDARARDRQVAGRTAPQGLLGIQGDLRARGPEHDRLAVAPLQDLRAGDARLQTLAEAAELGQGDDPVDCEGVEHEVERGDRAERQRQRGQQDAQVRSPARAFRVLHCCSLAAGVLRIGS
jgi:hypothetical protein